MVLEVMEVAWLVLMCIDYNGVRICSVNPDLVLQW